MVTVTELMTNEKIQWCPGCGDFGILTAARNAISQLNIDPKGVVVVSGIGCGSKIPHYIKCYGVETLHGRALPVAQGLKLANHALEVIAFMGDGDCYGIGMGHLIHAMRRNIDIVAVVHNNEVYGLTTGQTAPTSPKGWITKSTPAGSLDIPVNPIALALVSGATFVARGYAGDVKHLTDLIVEAVKHKGFAFIDVFQPCITFNLIHTYQWYQQNIYKLDDSNHDKKDFFRALELSLRPQEKLPIGIFYQTEQPTLESQLSELSKGPIAHQDISSVDITDLLKRYL